MPIKIKCSQCEKEFSVSYIDYSWKFSTWCDHCISRNQYKNFNTLTEREVSKDMVVGND